MKIRGYIKELVPNSFSIPVYKSEGKNYYHVLDDNFRITGFNETEIDNDTFISWYSDKNYEVGAIGAVVFVGSDNYIKCDDAISSVNEILSYLDETTEKGMYKNIKKEALYLRNIVIGQLQEEAAKEAFSNIQITPGAEDQIIAFEFIQPRVPGFAKWYIERLAEDDSYIFHIPHIAVKGDGELFFSKIFDRDNAAKVEGDPIQIEIVARLFEDYLNANLARSGAKVFNKPFLSKFSKMLESEYIFHSGISNPKSLHNGLFTADILNVQHHGSPWHYIFRNTSVRKVEDESETIYSQSKLGEKDSYQNSSASQKQARPRK